MIESNAASSLAQPFSPPPPEAAERQLLLLITGMSGAGKTTALKSLEDQGFECIDHLPLRLLMPLMRADAADRAHGGQPLAIGIDVRTRDFGIEAFSAVVDDLRSDSGIALKLVFLYCDDEELRRRYSATRHRHPLAEGLPLMDGIARERQMLSPIRKRADVTLDTSGLTPGEMKRILQGQFPLDRDSHLVVQTISFSFRSGLPRDADLVFDVRFLGNPYYEPELRALTGRDAVVARFIRNDPVLDVFLGSLTQLLHPLLPRYVAEGKSYLTIAIGCTGGRHRSVFVAEELTGWLKAQGYRVQTIHRDLDRSHRAEGETRAP